MLQGPHADDIPLIQVTDAVLHRGLNAPARSSHGANAAVRPQNIIILVTQFRDALRRLNLSNPRDNE